MRAGPAHLHLRRQIPAFQTVGQQAEDLLYLLILLHVHQYDVFPLLLKLRHVQRAFLVGEVLDAAHQPCAVAGLAADIQEAQRETGIGHVKAHPLNELLDHGTVVAGDEHHHQLLLEPGLLKVQLRQLLPDLLLGEGVA